eukprot:7861359-Pyramimonas_sp.AAC.1
MWPPTSEPPRAPGAEARGSATAAGRARRGRRPASPRAPGHLRRAPGPAARGAVEREQRRQ